MVKIIDFTFEGFKIRVTFVKDEEPPFDEWEVKNWNFIDKGNIDSIVELANNLGCTTSSIVERLEAACYEALENNDDEDDKPEEE